MPLVFLGTLGIVLSVYAYALGPSGREALTDWTATNLANLASHPLGAMVASAFVSPTAPWIWLPLGVVALVPLVTRFGNLRGLLLVASAHVIGTLAGEGVLAWRIAEGWAPSSLRFLADVGPSYVLVAALVAVLLYGRGRRWRAAALVALALLATGLSGGTVHLDVAAVGHGTALAVGAVVGGLMAWARVPPVRLRTEASAGQATVSSGRSSSA